MCLNDKEEICFLLPEASMTMLLGSLFASVCIKGCVIYLYGNIGVGKSVFCTGFLRKLGYVGCISSPTYTLIESYYVNNWCIHHFDLYRLNSATEIENIGFRDYFDGNAICLVEWPKKYIKILPREDISIIINYYDVHTNFRQVTIKFISNLSKSILASMSSYWKLFK